MTTNRERTITVRRWQQLAADLANTAAEVEARTITSEEASVKIGRLVTREALALGANTPLTHRPEAIIVNEDTDDSNDAAYGDDW